MVVSSLLWVLVVVVGVIWFLLGLVVSLVALRGWLAWWGISLTFVGGLLVGGLELWGMISMFSLVGVGLDCSVCGLLYLVAFDMLVAGVFRFDN